MKNLKRGNGISASQVEDTAKSRMTSQDVIGLYTSLEHLNMSIWIDGGWGVDALLGEQTRPHKDLDIVIQQKDVPRLRQLLQAQGYGDVQRDDTSPWNFVLGDNAGHEVDVHAIVFDGAGNGLYGPVERGVMYPAASLAGAGSINSRIVRCISPEQMVKFHTGYKLKDTDFHDVAALCERFGIEYPEEYAHLRPHEADQRRGAACCAPTPAV
ncbi:MAG: aminoglycoside nucleotidyltransferase [Chloroflexi bacterium]|nr:aminoglycoside nucleotidyltransferase [Chloroflexota bacterium]